VVRRRPLARGYLLDQVEQVTGPDIERWMVRLLGRYSQVYASIQYRALQQFFKWLAEEDEFPDPMARLRPPKVTDPLIPAFTSGELSALERACAGRTFAQRRDTAIIAVFRATGIRLAELAAIRYDSEDAHRSDIDLWQREITVCGKGGKTRIVRFGHQAARSLDRYLRLRARHAQAWRPQLWLGTSNRGPLRFHLCHRSSCSLSIVLRANDYADEMRGPGSRSSPGTDCAAVPGYPRPGWSSPLARANRLAGQGGNGATGRAWHQECPAGGAKAGTDRVGDLDPDFRRY
jgi:integrase